MISTIPSNFANVVTPFAPIGRQPVGEETPDLKNSTLKPLEASPETARKENRRSPDERAGEPGERERLELGRGIQEPSSGQLTNSDSANLNATEASIDSRRADQKALERELEQRRQQEIIKEVRQLAARDREVRAHEQAHAAVGGQYAGAPTYEFIRGPDGVSYAVAGEVSIDASEVPNDPQATLEKAQQVRRAAYAPAEPSVADRRVAAEASQMEAEARSELRQQQLENARARVAGDAERGEGVIAAAVSSEPNANAGEAVAEEPSPVGSSGSENAESVTNVTDIKSIDGSIDISRRLIESGAQPNPFPPGQLFNQQA